MSKLLAQKKHELIRTFFQHAEESDDERNLKDYEAYFNTFDTELNVLNSHETYFRLKLEVNTEQMAGIVLRAIPAIQQSPDATQRSILKSLHLDLQRLRQDLQQDLNNEQWALLLGEEEGEKPALELALDSVVRLWLMIDPSCRNGQDDIHRAGWRGDRQFCDFVHTQFYPCQPATAQEITQEERQANDRELAADMMAETMQVQSNLTHPLTAANMKKLTNIAIKWVSLLDEHLEFDADIRELSIFHHNRWLLDALFMVQAWENESPQRQFCPFPIPRDVLEETIKSLNLLFPPYNKPTTRFLAKNNMNLLEFRLRGHGQARNRAGSKTRLREFTFYHDRLIELAQEFISPPKDWSTIFRDYRNPIQYWTFWLGLVIFIATVASVGLGGAQVYYAQHAT